MPTMTGLHVGRYQILQRLSAGGMGLVYRAVAHGADGFKKPVVIKRIHGHLARDPAITSRFVNEAKLTMVMSHGNLVQVLDLGKLGQEYFIVLEYVDGKDLRSVLSRCRELGEWPSLPLALHIVGQVLHGLSYAHRRTDEAGRALGIVHRDVKPANILCSYEGEVKLTDFGVAKALASGHLTQQGTILGSLRYMSPEQAKGDAVDQRSDVFSLGAVLYTLLCREQPFAGEDHDAVVRAVVNARFLPPEAHGVAVPDELQQILIRALARDPARRHPSATAMLADLERFQRSRGCLASSSDLRELMSHLFLDDPTETGPLPETDDALVNAELEIERTSATDEEEGTVTAFTVSRSGPAPGSTDETRAATPRARAAARAGKATPEDPSQAALTTSGARLPRNRRLLGIAAGGVTALGVLLTLLLIGPGRQPSTRPAAASPGDGAPRAALDSRAGLAAEVRAQRAVDAPRAPPRRAGAHRAPPVKRPQARGWVRVSTQPAYAEVFLGDRRLDVTPCRIQLPVGAHQLRLVNAKLGRVVRRRVVVRADRETELLLEDFR